MKFSNNYLKQINLLSRIFQPINVIPKKAVVKKQDITSNSQRLMLDLGIISQANPGCFHYLPLGIRALQKLTDIIDNYMIKLGAQKIAMPSLTSAKLWKITGMYLYNCLIKFMLYIKPIYYRKNRNGRE